MNKTKEIMIVPATINDIKAISLLAKQTWPNAYSHIIPQEQLDYMLGLMYSEESLQKQFENGHFFLLAHQAEKSVAFASYNLTEQSGTYKLQKLYALPSQQGKGLGRKIIDYIIDEIKKEKAIALRLNVNRHNKALAFYKHLGFEIIKEEDIDIGNGYFMNDYVMEKTWTVD